jgi:hypothetical protein
MALLCWMICRVYNDETAECTASTRCLHTVIIACGSSQLAYHYTHVHLEQVVSQLQLKSIQCGVTVLANLSVFLRVCSVECLQMQADTLVHVLLTAINKWNLLLLCGAVECLQIMMARIYQACSGSAKVTMSRARRVKNVMMIGAEVIRVHVFICDGPSLEALTSSCSRQASAVLIMQLKQCCQQLLTAIVSNGVKVSEGEESVVMSTWKQLVEKVSEAKVIDVQSVRELLAVCDTSLHP